MKIAIVSDIHSFHWDRYEGQDFHPVETVKRSLLEEKPDLILDAGDYEKEIDWGIKSYSIPGNHDYYGKEWKPDNIMDATKSFKVEDIHIAMTTLWGDFKKHNPLVM